MRPVGAELFHADEQTDMTKLIVAFRNFANNAPINRAQVQVCWLVLVQFERVCAGCRRTDSNQRCWLI
jgi:hypothetical protein